MPFTVSHAAAAIPFRRTRLIMSAIVMGCFVPDFPHFFFIWRRTSFGHTFAGMFLLDLPLAIAALWLFHAFIKKPMLMFLPGGIRRRLTTSVNTFSFWPAKRLALIVISILAGTSTHLLWDAFTHRNSWIYHNWALLRQPVDLPLTGEMRMYKLLEYANSVFGIAVVAFWIWLWYRTANSSAPPVAQPGNLKQRRTFVIVAPVAAIAAGAVRAWYEDGIHLQIRSLVHFTTELLVSAITFFLIELFVCGLFLRRSRGVPASCPPAEGSFPGLLH